MLGTIINVATVIIGSLIGLLVHSKLSSRITEITFQGIGIFTIFLGIVMAMKSTEFLIIIISIVAGSILGELLNIEKWFDKLSSKLKVKLKFTNTKFSEGLVTAFLLFCMGSMTILGAIEEGLGGKPNLLLTKSIMDGFSSIALSSALGIGVLFSVIPLLIYQGGLTLLTKFFGNYFNDNYINNLSSVGGLLLIGMGIRILEIKKIRVLNMLPALLIVLIMTYIVGKI
jgi:uncharacterized membrane protein YqgA involved in biofilm formation